MRKTSANDFEVLCCPRCLGKLIRETCTQCGTSYDEVLGIFDLRWPKSRNDDPKEAALLEKIIEHYPTSTFQQLVTIRFQQSKLPEEIKMAYHQYSLDPQERSRQMSNMFQERVTEKFGFPDSRVALDLGCGVGASVKILSPQFEWVVGIDIDLISLILARKFLEDQKVENFVLAQAYAQKLPLHDGVVNFAVAQNVLEHLFEVEAAMREMRRVLADGGCFCGDSRNRYDLFLQEPHAKLRWVGFWPRRWQAWYVWHFRRMVYDHTRLLSLVELRKHAHQAFGPSVFVSFPDSSAYGRSTVWNKYIKVIEKIPLIGWLFLFFFPSHLLVAQVESKSMPNRAKA